MRPYLLRIKAWAGANWLLLSVLVFALFLRIALRAELLLDKNVYSFQMAADSWSVAATIRDGIFQKGFIQNLVDVRSNQGLLHILLNIPLVILYVTFGFGRFISIGYSLITSAINIILVYSITKRLFDLRAGLIASLILALVPIDVLLGGLVSPITPVVTISLFSVFLLIEASMKLNWRYLLVALIPIIFIGLYSQAIGISLFILALTAVILLATQTNRIRLKFTDRHWPYIISISLFLFLTFLFLTTNIDALFSAFVNTANSPGVFLHLVFFLVSIGVLQKNHGRNSMALIFWFLLAILGLAISIPKNGANSSLWLGEPYLFVFLPIVIAEGAYFSKQLNAKSMKWFVAVIIGLSLASLPIIYGNHELISNYATFSFVNANILLNLSEISAGLAVIGIVLSPVLLSYKWHSNVSLAAVLLFAFLFAMYPAIWKMVSPHRETMLSAEQGYQFLQNQPIKLPVYFALNNKRDLYSFIQGLDAVQGGTHLSLRKDVAGLNEIGDGYIVVPEETFNTTPEHWLELIATGLIQDRDIIYRSLIESTAINELENAAKLAQESPTQENQDRLFAAEINSGRPCEAYNTWIKKELKGNNVPAYIQISDGLDCFKETIEQNSPITEILTPGFESLASLTSVYDPDLATTVWSIYQREFIYSDPRAISFEEDIKPNSFYVYTGWFKAKEEATFLYWELGNWEEFVTHIRTPEWTRFGALIYTGNNWDDQPKITLYPTLIDNYGFVYLYDVKFIEISSAQN